MRIRSIVVAVVAVVVFSGQAFARGPVGVWKVNIAKSKYSPGPAPKSGTITTTAVAGGGFKSVNEGVPATGAPTRSEVTFKFDGKDNPVTGNPNADTQSYTQTDGRHWTVVSKKAGSVTVAKLSSPPTASRV